jgi:hypothetical protein
MVTKQRLASTELLERVRTGRQCPYCGKELSNTLVQCPHCHETLPEIRKARATPVAKHGQIRQGLLYMLLAAVIHYFAAGYSALTVPYAISSVVATYLTPLLFLSGMALILYGLYLGNGDSRADHSAGGCGE